MNELKFSADEAKAISFLLLLPQLTVNTAFLLKKVQKNSKVTRQQILMFAMFIPKMDAKLVSMFLMFELSISGQDVMDEFGVKGPEVGHMIQKLETKKFEKLLG